MNRRQFARSLAAISGTGLLGATVNAMAQESGAVHVVCDTRVTEFNALRLSARIGPAYYHTFDGDVTWLWLDVLRSVWRDSHAATAGFTRHAEFFVLSTLAREYRYSVAATDEKEQYLSWLLLPDAKHDLRYFEHRLPS